jgi:hypothetical protein
MLAKRGIRITDMFREECLIGADKAYWKSGPLRVSEGSHIWLYISSFIAVPINQAARRTVEGWDGGYDVWRKICT